MAINSTPLESKVQRDIKKYLTKIGYLVFKMEASEAGYPDLFATRTVIDCLFLETKRAGKSARALQEYRHKQLRKKGRVVYVIDSIEKCMELIK